jgi:hypothetical protein
MNIEKELCPEVGQLQFNGEEVFAIILDAELDEFKVEFKYDMSAYIDTKYFNHIYLTAHNCEIISDLIYEAEDYFREYYKNK